MKIGITGSSGFIGKRLVKKLEEDGFEVFKFVRRDVQLIMKFFGVHQNKKLI